MRACPGANQTRAPAAKPIMMHETTITNTTAMMAVADNVLGTNNILAAMVVACVAAMVVACE